MIKRALLAAAIFLTVTSPALAEMSQADLDKMIATGNIVGDEITKKECGACHMVYGPINMLGQSWRVLMNDLANHFGEYASLDEETRKHIEEFMVGKSMDASGYMYGKMMAKKIMKKIKKKKMNLPIRLTDMPGWSGEHRKSKIGPELW